jgi:hypothetical protein
LRHAAQVNAGIGKRHGAVFDQQLEVAVVSLGGGVGPSPSFTSSPFSTRK